MQDKEGSLRVWWIPQVPGKPFQIPVASVMEARKIMVVLADYDIFQFKNKIKPDYSNAGGLELFEKGEWSEWHCPECDDDVDDCECPKD